METLYVEYPTLRRTVEQVQQFMIHASGVDTCTLKSSLEDDLSLYDDDISFLLEEFATKFTVDFRQSDFDRYFTSGSSEGGLLRQLVMYPITLAYVGFLLIFWLGQQALALLVWPFSTPQAEWIMDFSLNEYIYPQPKKPAVDTFNVGDLVASAVAGRFVKREHARFVLTR